MRLVPFVVRNSVMMCFGGFTKCVISNASETQSYPRNGWCIFCAAFDKVTPGVLTRPV